MAKVEIIAKLKQKNDADFKIADAKDIEMEDGSDLQSTIDNIKKNGTNIDTEKYATKEELETKADKEHTHDYNDIANAPTIPSIDGLATEEYVDTAIANAQLGGGEIDTSNFATKEDLNAKVDKKLGYSLVSDSEINRLSSIDNYDDTEIKNELNNKSDLGHTHSYKELSDKPTIPSIEGLATENYVKNEIANAQLSSGEVDLSGYATKEELSVKADKIHTHTIADVDNLQTTLNNKSDLGHTHSYNDITNTPEIPSIEGLATKEELNNKVDKLEGHSLISDSEIIRLSKVDNYDDTELRNKLNNKSDKGHRHDYSEITNPPVIPSIEGLATEDYVKNEIANAQLSQGEVDLSGYATKNDLDTKVDKINGYSLVSDIEITRLSGLHNYDDTEIRNKLNNKTDKGHSHDYSEISNTPTIPSIEGLATEIYVDTKIAEAQLSGGEIDLSGYVTKDELNNKADKTELHSHSNKNILDGITQDKISSWDNKSDFSGKYEDLENTPTIPTVDVNKSYVDTQLNKKVDKKNGYSLISDTEIQRLANVDNYDDTEIRSTLDTKANKTDLHSHSNKAILDGITATKVQEWDNKSTFSGDYNDLLNKPEIPSLDGYATQTYVKNEIANAQLGSGQEVDLSGYATKDDLNAKVDKRTGYSLVADSEIARLSKLTNYDDTTIKNSLNNKVDKIEGYSLISDSEIERLANVNNYDDTEIRNTLSGKANKSDLHSHGNKIVLDEITSTDIDNWNSKTSFSGDYNDLTNKPTLHTHSNKTILDTITSTKISSWDNKSDFSGNYEDLTNKPTIPSKTSELTNDSNYVTSTELNKKADKTELHSHSNKTVLDGITSTDINNWNNKSSFDGDYDSLTNKPTIPTKTSQLTNDSNFVNTTQLNTKVDKKIGYSLIADSEIERLANVDNYNDTSIKNTLNNKADKEHTHSYNDLTNKPTIPSIEGLATETFVTNKIAEAQLTQGEVDLSGYATKDELNNKADKTDLHSHSNKKVLDGITSTKVNSWDNKSDFSGDYNDLTNKPSLHSHSNKTILDTVTDEKITEWDNKSTFSGNYNDLTNKPTIPTKTSQLTNDSGYVTSSSLHSHSNKTVLDTITSDKVASWDNKSDFSGDYNDLTNKPTIPTVDVTKSYVDNQLNTKVDKKVGYSLISDSEIERLANVDNYDDTAIKNTLNNKANKTDLHSHSNKTILDSITSEKINEWNNKSSFSGSYNDLTDKPTIPTVDVNKSYVDNALSKKVDKKTGYSLVADSEIERLAGVDNYDDTEIKNELSKKANSSDLHSHSNKTVLDGITSSKVNEWNNKSTFSGNYNDLTNKPTIPTKTSQLTNDSNFATTSQLHNHSNKTILDGITSDKIESWDNKSSFSGSYNDLTDKPKIPVVDSTLSSTSTNAIQNKVVKSALDGKASSSHSHAIADITNLQATLNSKSDTTHTHSYNDLSDKPTIPTIPTIDSALSTTSTNAVQNKVVTNALNNKADKMHTHSYNDLTNKPSIPVVTNDLTNELKANYDSAYEHSQSAHAPSNAEQNVQSDWNVTNTTSDAYIKNKPTIPTKTSQLTNDSGYVTSSSLHSHSNKIVLDGITAEKVEEWDGKSTFSGDYNDLTNKPTIPKVDSSLSTTSTNAIQNKVVTNALNNKANSSDVYTKTQTDNLLSIKADKSELHSHSNKTVLDTITNEKVTEWNNKSDFSGSYNDLTNKPTIPIVDSALSSTSTNAIQNKVVKTALDGKANSSHSHSISDITNLQTTLNSKSDTSHTHNYAGSSSAGGDATNALACSGNASTATKLQTARTINGTSFDGSANITTSKWGTARSITIGNTTKVIDGSSNVSWTLREMGIYDSVVKIVTNVQELESAMSQGGVIYIVEGIYQLGENLSLEYVSNTHLIALGDVTISINTNSSNYIAMRPKLNGTEGGYTAVENFNMSGITFDGKGTSNKAGLFATAHSRNVHIEGCTFKNLNCSWHLVEVNSSDTVVFDRCTFSDYNYRDIAEGDYFTEAVQLDYAGEGGLYPFTCLLDNTGCQNITFNNCTFTRVKTTWTACLGSHSYLKDSMPKNITLNGCRFEDIDNCIYGLDYKNLSVLNSTFYNVATAIIIDSREDNDGTSISAIGNRYDGCNRSKNISQFNGTDEGRFIMHHNYHNRLSSSNISNNFIEKAYSHGIGISPVDTTIIGNSVRYCGKHGIYLYGGQQTTIIGNTSVGCGTLSWYTGRDIYIAIGSLGYVKRCIITNNAAYVYTDGNSYEATKIQDNL